MGVCQTSGRAGVIDVVDEAYMRKMGLRRIEFGKLQSRVLPSWRKLLFGSPPFQDKNLTTKLGDFSWAFLVADPNKNVSFSSNTILLKNDVILSFNRTRLPLHWLQDPDLKYKRTRPHTTAEISYLCSTPGLVNLET